MFRTNFKLAFQSKNFKKDSEIFLKEYKTEHKLSNACFEFLRKLNLSKNLNELDKNGITLIGPIPKSKDH